MRDVGHRHLGDLAIHVLAPLRKRVLPGIDLLGGQPAVVHGHRHDLLLDRLVDDALGEEEGRKVRVRTARDAWMPVLDASVQGTGADSVAQRLEVFRQLFEITGHGQILIEGDAQGGTARGDYLHRGLSHNQEYGERIRHSHPVDAVAAGFAAAALTIATRASTPMTGRELTCIVDHAEGCTFTLEPDPSAEGPRHHRLDLSPRTGGPARDEVESGIRGLITDRRNDERGLAKHWGSWLTRQPVAYGAALRQVVVAGAREKDPRLVDVAISLLRDAGRIDMLHLFIRILTSPEWASMFGPIWPQPSVVAASCSAIARSLGHGGLTVESCTRSRLVVLADPDPEASWRTHLPEGAADAGSAFLVGMAMAIAQVAWLDWKDGGPEEVPRRLLESPRVRVDTLLDQALGDPTTGVVVER